MWGTLYLFVFGSVITLSTSAPNRIFAESCDAETCQLPSCKCAETVIPAGLTANNTPQFVLLTFDDDVNGLNFNNYYSQALYNRTNPDGCNISATFFVSHEYTEYDYVHDLYVQGHEIALHSITHSSNTTYWSTLPVEDFVHEFGDEKTLIAHFASIPISNLTGMRLPLLQMAGENSFSAIEELGLQYDCSWPTSHYVDPGLWPYTLDFSSFQDCPILPCPAKPHPGVWVQPMIEWTDNEGVSCNMVDGCVNIPEDSDGILEFIKRNFLVQYSGDKAPFGFYLHSAWFDANPERFVAYEKFLDYLATLPDVYVVNVQYAVDWAKSPIPLGAENWPACKVTEHTECNRNDCRLVNSKGEERYMSICLNDCPEAYPWLDNPLGQ